MESYITMNSLIPVSNYNIYSIAIELIMAFLMREEAFSLKKQRDQFITKEAAKQIFWDEILKMNQLIKKLFAKCDSESGDSGLLNHTQMRECLLKCKMTTKRENNILIENYCNKDDMYEYKKFSEDMYDIRYNLAKTNLLDQNIDKIQGHIIKICEPYEKIEKNEKCISIRDLKEVLMSSKMFNLTLMQVYLFCKSHNIGLYPNWAGGIRCNQFDQYQRFCANCKRCYQGTLFLSGPRRFYTGFIPRESSFQ